MTVSEYKAWVSMHFQLVKTLKRSCGVCTSYHFFFVPTGVCVMRSSLLLLIKTPSSLKKGRGSAPYYDICSADRGGDGAPHTTPPYTAEEPAGW